MHRFRASSGDAQTLDTLSGDVGMVRQEDVVGLEAKVKRVRVKITQWLDALKLSNGALCELSTAMTDLTASTATGDDEAMKSTNATLVSEWVGRVSVCHPSCMQSHYTLSLYLVVYA
jgi:hypothetical protein